MSRNYTGLGRYEQLFDQLDAAMSRLESRWEAIDRRVTKLQASKAAYRRYSSNYDTDPYQQPIRFRPCHEQPPGWPPPQRSPPSCWPAQRRRHAYGKQQQTHAYRQQHQPVAAHMEPLNCRFGDSRPRHQSNPTPVFEQSTYTCTLSDAALQNPDAEYHVGQSDYLPPHPPYTDSYGQTQNSSSRYHLWQPELPLPDRSRHPPTPRPPSYRRSASPCQALADSPAATTQSRSCHDQPTVVLQPLLSPTSLQRSAIPPMASAAVPPPSSHPPSTRPATQLVSCEEMHLGVEGDSEVLNQVDLQLNEKNLVDEEVRAIEVRKIDENGGLLDSSTIATFEFDGGLAMTYETRVDADAFSLMYPSIKTEKLLMYPPIKTEKLQNLYFVELQDAWREMVNGLQDMSFLDAMKRTFDIRDVYIKHMIVGYWGTKQLAFAFDPGGDISTKLWLVTLFVVLWIPH